ncbi:MAG: twin-arginine translocase subunit TatC [Candidatus Marinimicrobia bacterium]|nr:twin-arginine translocase subunit TatC [Candidatus Neomarinimicrobiota bacterium]
MQQKMTDDKVEMGFLDHLEEFRWRIIKSLAAVIIGAIISFVFIDIIMKILVAPTLKIGDQFTLQVLKVQGMFMVKWGLAFVGGFILGLPIITYQLWKFVAPGLYGTEVRYILPIIIFTYVAFLCGILFAYFVIIPFSLKFFTSMGYGDVQNNISINYYFSFITWLMMGAGIIFEMPIVSFILSSVGILTPKFLRTYRRHAIVTIMILSAFITPPDPVSMIIMTFPLIILYEISVLVSAGVNRAKRTKEDK